MLSKIEVGKVGISENSKSIVMDGVNSKKIEKFAKVKIPRASCWMERALKIGQVGKSENSKSIVMHGDNIAKRWKSWQT